MHLQTSDARQLSYQFIFSQGHYQLKTFGYSTDGFNLLTRVGDCKGNQTLDTYKPGSNLLIKKLIYDKGSIKKRTFQTYNEDAVCIKTIEDDGIKEKESDLTLATERHIQEITPKTSLPGVDLPEIIEEKAYDFKAKQEILVKKLRNSYDAQGDLLSCDSYNAKDQYAFVERRNYNTLGQVTSQTDAIGRITFYT